MLHPAPDRAEVQIEHITFDGRRELLTFRCTVKALRATTAIIQRDSKVYCEEVDLARLDPHPDPAYWCGRGGDNNYYIMAQNPATNGI